MRTTTEGLELIASFEGCSLTPYRDQGGTWTNGRGNTHGVNADTPPITQEQADADFRRNIQLIETLVLSCLPGVDLSNNQLSALVSFCYNEGLGYKGVKDGFQVLKSGEPSTMLKLLRARKFEAAAAEFPKWDKVQGKESAGILRRRLAEQALFLKPDEPA